MMTRTRQMVRRKKVGHAARTGTFGFLGASPLVPDSFHRDVGNAPRLRGLGGTTGATPPLTSFTYTPQFSPIGMTALTSMSGSTGNINLPAAGSIGSTPAPSGAAGTTSGLSKTQMVVIGVALGLAALLFLFPSDERHP